MSVIDVYVFVAHAFSPRVPAYSLDRFRASIDNLIRRAADAINAEKRGITVNAIVEMASYGERLSPKIRSELARCHLGLIDISDNNPNVLYELGYLTARGVPRIIFKSALSNSQFPVPADIRDEFAFQYSDISEIESVLLADVTRELRVAISDPKLPSAYVRSIWFPITTGSIFIVSSSEPAKSRHANRVAPNYMYLDNLGDKDAVLQTMIFLARFYPFTSNSLFAADEFDFKFREDNLVVIGGPGDAQEGNILCKEMMELVDSQISYSDDCESLVFRGISFSATKDANGAISEDFGYFARFPNPLNPTRHVLLVNGIHTFGVKGAIRAFSDHVIAQLNMRKVLDANPEMGEQDLAFETFFRVKVFPNGEVAVPELERDRILPLGNNR